MKKIHDRIKKASRVICFLLSLSSFSQPNFQWANGFGGTYWDGGNSIVTDVYGNVFTCGQFAGTIDLDPGPGVYTLSCGSSSCDIFISKQAANGNLVWARSIGGTRYNSAYAIATDAASNVYITGTFIQNVDFDPGPGTYFINSYSSLNDYSAFICKLDSSGSFLWARDIHGPGYEWGTAIAVDVNGNVYTTGCFQNTTDFDPGPAVYNMNTLYGSVYIHKLDVNGNFVWAKQLAGNAVPNALVLDGKSNVYTAGRFYQSIDMDPGPGIFNLTSQGLRDVFVSKLDSLGNFVWGVQAGGKGNEEAKGITLGNSNTLYITGYFEDTIAFQTGNGMQKLVSAGKQDIFLWRMHASSNFFWAKRIGGDSNDVANAITADPQGFIYLTGEFGDTVDFDPGWMISNLASSGRSDVFVARYSGIGKLVCAGKMGGAGLDIGTSIDIDPWGNIALTGKFSDTADLDPGISAYDLASGYNSVFIELLGDCALPTGEIEHAVDPKNSFYPNPSKGKLYLGEDIEPGSFSIYNSIGQPVLFTIIGKEIDLSSQPDGIYFIRIGSEQRSIVKKIVLSR